MASNYIPAFSFNFLTPFYDFFVELLGYGTGFKNKVIYLLKLRSDEKLLDIGCGTGTLLILSKKRFPAVEMAGVDIDKKILEIARNKAKKENMEISFIQSDAQKLPFASSSFDVVVSTLIFHHLPTSVKKTALREIDRILKKNGRFLLVDFGKKDRFRLYLLDFFTWVFRIPEHQTLQDNLKGLIPTFIKEAGFKIQEISPRYQGVQFLLATKS